MLKSGSVVFDCQVDKLLDENEVYQSYSVNCPDVALLKLIYVLPNPLFTEEHRQSFFEIVESLSRQQLPGVGAPVKAGEVDGHLACLYPLPSGRELDEILKDNLTAHQAVTLIRDLSELLVFPHQTGYCHGNISLQTIYFDGESPSLADFSLCQLLQLDYQAGIDPRYTSPEQVRGEDPYSASDIYNLGCILYRLVTGRTPFSGRDPFAIARQHLSGEFPLLPEELVLLQPVLDSMTDIVAEKRISAADLSERLTRLLENPEIGQLKLPMPIDQSRQEDSSTGESTSLPDGVSAPSEMAARVEARLKEHADQLFEEATAEIPGTEDEEIVAGSSMIGEKRASGLGRILLILFVGILLGIGLHYSLNNFSVTEVAQQDENVKELQPPVDLDRGLQLWEKKDFNGAEAEFKRIISLHPEDPRTYNNLAAFYAAQGNYEQARDYLEQALTTDEVYETIYHNLGAVYAEMARGSYGRALRLAKTNQIVSLPVFSGQGVVSVEPSTRSDSVIQVVDNTVKMPEETADESKIVVESGTAESIGNVAASTTPAATSESSDEETTAVSTVNATATHGGEDMTSQGSGSAAEQEVVVKQESPQDFLRHWAQAWSDQDVSAYLSFYGENFVPPGGRTRQVWETQRQQRLTHPKSIEVTLDSFQLLEQDDNHVKVEVIQGYKSDVLSDKTRKVFDLQRDGSSWKILRERSLGAVR